VKSLRERCPSRWASFGLNSEYVKEITYEQIVFLQHHGKFTFTEAYNLPIGLRNWFVDKNVDIIEKRNEQQTKENKSR
jgi:hypothetical protein